MLIPSGWRESNEVHTSSLQPIKRGAGHATADRLTLLLYLSEESLVSTT